MPDQKCDFHARLKGIPMVEVADIVDPVFRNNFSPGRYDSREHQYRGDDLATILGSLTGATNDAVIEALRDHLIAADPAFGDELFYQDDRCYERSDAAFGGHGLLWDAFCRQIQHEQRFFNERARELLADIFQGIHRQRDTSQSQPVTVIEPGTDDARFMRVRLAEEAQTRKDIAAAPAIQMGPPPLRKRTAGRMNPSGICAFYAAYDLLTCIAEMRPRVGSVLISAEFELIRPIVALDTTKFGGELKEPNLFAKDHVRRTAQWRFMQKFMHEIARPISPGDQHLDYVPTQAVGEYLLRHHDFFLKGEQAHIEAIIFRSAQHPAGKNIVIFGNACSVEQRGTGARKLAMRPSSTIDSLLDGGGRHDADIAEPHLRFIAGSLKQHVVDTAEYTPKDYIEPFDEG